MKTDRLQPAKPAQEFMHDRSMTADQVDMDQSVRTFLSEMEKGLTGSDSSLHMIPTYLNSQGDLPLNTPVIVLDAGGTNFRVAQVQFTSEGKALIEKFQKYPMPGSQGYISKEEFFDTIVGYMRDVLDSWSSDSPPYIGFCFSYPTEITPEKDGKLLHFSKEINAHEVEGQMIGANLNQALTRHGYSLPAGMVLLNDTVATLLAGKSASAEHPYSAFIGFILGTGTNSAYVEQNKNIGKLPQKLASATQIINMESGALNVISGGSIDENFDQTTKRPGFYRFEKMISGAYLGPLGSRVLEEAIDAGLFSPDTAAEIKAMLPLDTVIMDRFLHNPYSRDNPLAQACSHSADRSICFCLLDTVIERAAKMAAVNLSATILKGDAGTDPACPVAVCADGTTFFKTKDLMFRTRYYLKQYLEGRHGRYIEILHHDDAPIIGAAVAALLNL
ncbi:MAG: hexokinase [Spirochaetaceae bacterium]|nr:hexokinase [Spirochaetaceae bacterium]MCF7948028.1 hexokinase [Spirochaetia bacterium]MCF7952244.1 hexokinase [Spirochaetaceae bacterium]